MDKDLSIIKHYYLTPHPEGGWFRRTYTCTDPVSIKRGDRNCASSILYFLKKGEKSCLHYLDSDEIWYHQTEGTGFTAFQASEGVKDSDNNTGTLLGSGFNLKPVAMPFTGDLLYVESRAAVNRTADQTEDIKVIIEI